MPRKLLSKYNKAGHAPLDINIGKNSNAIYHALISLHCSLISYLFNATFRLFSHVDKACFFFLPDELTFCFS